jgi:uncharacterized protein
MRIIYLHGFASSPASTKARRFRERMEQSGARVEVPDLAAGDFEHLTIGGQLALLERLAAGEAISLAGSSMGGYLAALYAARHPEVRRLVLLAPAFGFCRRWLERIGPESMAEWRAKGVVDVFHYAEGREMPLHHGLIDDAMRYEDYPDFRQPALVFHGLQDDVVPAAASQEFAATHPNAELELVESGHDLHNVLDSVTEASARFLLEPALP